MHRFHLLHTVALAIFFLAPPSFAISIAPLTIDQQASEAEIIIRGTVESTTSYRSDGFIYSDTVIGVTEIFSGDAPGRITLTYRGGRFENRGETVTDVPIFQNGDDRIFFLVTDDKGFLRPYAGPESAPLTDQDRLDRLRQRFPESQKTSYSPRGVQSPADPERTITSSETEGLLLPPRRTITPDRGEPIGYLVDADFLPAGISLETALQAVESALSAWSEVSSVKFRFDGLVSFGTSARDLEVSDRRLRIQLHDIYGKISGSSVLGFGGQVYRWIGDFPDGGSGGRIYDTEFDETIRSFVVLSHTASSMENPAIFEGVLAHE
ncbi:MAG TPA: hypothetical protein VK041_06825, partial [Opitutales bacterium]|nr:hypothetical protein [Opitutales bacterium]